MYDTKKIPICYTFHFTFNCCCVSIYFGLPSAEYSKTVCTSVLGLLSFLLIAIRTFIDKYVYWTFTFIFSIVMETAIVSKLDKNPDDKDDIDRGCFYFFLSLWISSHIAFVCEDCDAFCDLMCCYW